MIAALALAVGAPLTAAVGQDPGGGPGDAADVLRPAGDLAAPLEARTHAAPGPGVAGDDGDGTKVAKRLDVAGRGERLAPGGTTDVWAHGAYAYLGTFNNPCGTGAGFGVPALVDDRTGPGIAVFDVRNPTDPTYVGSIPSVAGSRTNDVKVMTMNQGDVLVHSNEACSGGPGGFEVYDVSDPLHPTHLAHVQTDDVNALLREDFGFTDFGVHNLYLFTRDGRDYAAAQVEGLLGNFQVFDITDPANVQRVAWFGAEQLVHPDVNWATTTNFSAILDANAYLNSGHGASQNRFLHDFYVTPDGERAWLANWDAGLLLVDLGGLSGQATLISQAIDTTSEDGEVNSHSVWPTADGATVVEGEEDFSPFAVVFNITTGPHAGEYPATEGAITVPMASLPGRTLAGPTVYVGYGCEGSIFEPGAPYNASMPTAPTGDHLALIQRGGCLFSEKVDNAEAAGYAGVVVFNDAARGDALVSMGGDPTNLPGVFVGHSTGLKIAGEESADNLTMGAEGENVTMVAEPDGWSGFRIWDYTDPANPVLTATVNTVCSADPVHESCDARGTYSSHNVIVEGHKAYVSWYSDGVLVFDVSDPTDPREVARYHEAGEAFEAQNGGIQDVWGVYKVPEEPWVYASDRNGGLYVLKERGGGSTAAGGS